MNFLHSKEVLADIERFYVKKNKSAGVRIRSYMAKAKRMEQSIRDEIQVINKTLPVKQIKSNKQKQSTLKA